MDQYADSYESYLLANDARPLFPWYGAFVEDEFRMSTTKFQYDKIIAKPLNIGTNGFEGKVKN